MYDRGVSREGDLLDLATEDKIVDKSGSWLNYGDVRLGQGRENAKQFLRDHPALMDELSQKVLAKRGLLNQLNAAPSESNTEANEPQPKSEPAARKEFA